MAGEKADAAKRILAVLIDTFIAAVIFVVIDYFFNRTVAALLAGGFLLFRDVLPSKTLQGASIGKKIMGLMVIRGDGRPCDALSSVKRNLPIALGYLVYAALSLLYLIFSIIPFFGIIFGLATAISGVIWLLAIGMELYKVMNDEDGIRLGDLLADTHVVEIKSGSDSATVTPPPITETK